MTDLVEAVEVAVVPGEARRGNRATAIGAAVLALVLLVAGAAAAITASELGWGAPLAGLCPSGAGLIALGLAGWWWLGVGYGQVKVVVTADEVRVERHHPLRRRVDVLRRREAAVETREHAVDLVAEGQRVTIAGLTPDQVDRVAAAVRSALG